MLKSFGEVFMKTIQVVAAVIMEENEVFVTRRNYGDFKNMWEFPGGKIEPGEAREAALIREIKEELELDIKVLDFIVTVDYDYSSFHLKMDCFLCNISGGKLKLNVHNDAKWVNINKLDELTWIPADILVVEKIKGL